MSRPNKHSTSRAGVFDGHAPSGYTELTVVDGSGFPMLRVFARDDVARRYGIERLAYTVLDDAIPPAVESSRSNLRVLR